MAPSQHPSARTLLRWSRRTALALLALLIALAAAGAIYQVVGEWRDARRFPQRGRSVQAGAVKLNLDCTGQASPTVILDSGMGVPAVGWIKVQPEVAKFARVCSYDRAGYGWSQSGPPPRTSLQIARELKALLDAAGEKGPYILVGHSFGGFNIRVYTGLYPSDVAGVVLVDASHEDEEERIGSVLPAAVRKQEKEEEDRDEMLERIFTPIVIHLGIQRFSVAAGWADMPNSLSKDLVEELLYLERQTKFRNAVVLEDKSSAQSVAQVRSAGNLGNRPLIVLTAGKPYEPEPLLTKTDLEKQRKIWIDVLQVEEAHLSTRGKQIVVPDSDHMIPFERPDAVISAIREVWSGVAKR
jgi:pimeloyl-ACP methyl ester carboxylesterase